MAEQRTEKWFQQRSGKVTASRAWDLLNSPRGLLIDLIRDRLDLPKRFTGNAATEWGTENEQNAIDWYQERSGNRVESCGFFLHPLHHGIGASPDGIVYRGEDKIGLLEAKCPYSQQIPDAPKENHLLQIQLQLECTGLERCDLVYWAPNQQTSFSVARDPELAHTLLEAAVNLLERIEVIMADDPQGWLEEAERGREHRDRDWMRAVADYRTAKAEADAATQGLAQAKAKLEELSEGADSHGYGLTLRWISRRGNVDWTKVSKDFELTPKTLDQYRKEPSIFSRIVED